MNASVLTMQYTAFVTQQAYDAQQKSSSIGYNDLNHVLLTSVRTETKTKSLQYSTLLYSLTPKHCTLDHRNHCAPHCTEQHPVAPFGRKNFRRGRATYLRVKNVPKIEVHMCVSAETERVCVLYDLSN